MWLLRSSAQAGLYTGKISDLNVIVPAFEIQNEFENRIMFVHSLKGSISVKNTEELFNTLIQKAFSNEFKS